MIGLDLQAEAAVTETQFESLLTKFIGRCNGSESLVVSPSRSGVECFGRVATKVGQVFYAFPKADKKYMTLAEFEVMSLVQ